MKPYSYILLTSETFRTKIYIPPSTLNNGRCVKISATGVEQKPNYDCDCLKFSEPFTKLQLCLVKGSEPFLSPSVGHQHSNFALMVAYNGPKISTFLY